MSADRTDGPLVLSWPPRWAIDMVTAASGGWQSAGRAVLSGM